MRTEERQIDRIGIGPLRKRKSRRAEIDEEEKEQKVPEATKRAAMASGGWVCEETPPRKALTSLETR